MGITRRTRQLIAAEAVDWFLQFQERTAAEPDHQGFSEWLLRSPAHVEEYLQVSCAWSLVNVDAAGDLEATALVALAKAHHETDNVVALPIRFRRRLPPAGRESGRVSSGRRWRAAALAASLVAGITLWVFFLELAISHDIPDHSGRAEQLLLCRTDRLSFSTPTRRCA